ncbi:MAG: DUF1295 domain-containing protein [Parachlamydiaceae bacterium]|nr:DUF1295 domain-containing protein [Parachlamydiaceae bacterium]
MLEHMNNLIDILFIMGVAFLAVELFMILFWMIFTIQRKVSLVDIAWGLSFIIANLIYFIIGQGFVWRKMLVMILVAVWASRLVIHLINRFRISQDDPRYTQLLGEQGSFLTGIANYNFKVLCLFLFQGLLVTVLSIPFAIMNENAMFFFETTEVFGILIWMVGFIGETIADFQLMQFKKNPANLTNVLQEGLWKYSRHPNYFFEWIIWIGYCVMAFSSSWGFLAIISPIMILYLLFKVSGIPLAEQESIRTKGDAYRDYQSRTSVFFPWFYRSRK